MAIAGLVAAVLAVNQWLHWMGITNGDLFSLIPGFAQAGMQANAYADEKGFHCANKSLGAEAELMSEEMLQTVGSVLCTDDGVQVASLRGTDNFYVNQQSMMRNRARRTATLRLQTRERGVVAERPQASMLVAAIEPGRLDTNQDLLDRIEARARRLEAITPGDRVDDPRPIEDPREDIRLDDDIDLVDDDHSGSGSGHDEDVDDDNSGHGSGDDDDHSGSSNDDDDHSGSGGGDDDDRSGSSDDDDDHSGSGSSDDRDDSDHEGEDDHDGSGSGDDREDDDDDDNDNSGSGSGSSHT